MSRSDRLEAPHGTCLHNGAATAEVPHGFCGGPGGEELAFEDHVDKAVILNFIDLQKGLGVKMPALNDKSGQKSGG
jgi:hypothetical protein